MGGSFLFAVSNVILLSIEVIQDLYDSSAGEFQSQMCCTGQRLWITTLRFSLFKRGPLGGFFLQPSPPPVPLFPGYRLKAYDVATFLKLTTARLDLGERSPVKRHTCCLVGYEVQKAEWKGR